MTTFRMVSSLTFVLTAALLLEDCLGQGGQRRRNRNRQPSRGGEGLPSVLQQAYQQAVDGHGTPSMHPDTGIAESESVSPMNDYMNELWQEFMPSIPAPSDVECHIEVFTIRTIGGRCSRLGGVNQPYICQSGPHFDFKPECEQFVSNSGQRAVSDSGQTSP